MHAGPSHASLLGRVQLRTLLPPSPRPEDHCNIELQAYLEKVAGFSNDSFILEDVLLNLLSKHGCTPEPPAGGPSALLHKVLFVVMGSSDLQDRLLSMRDTWLAWVPASNVVMLSDAPAPGLNITVLPELPADAYLEEVFGNVSARDNYHKANLRHLKSVQWLGQQKQEALLDIDWVMMVDDDTFVNVPLLLHFLAQFPASLPMSFGIIIDSGPWDPFLKGVAFPQGGAGMLFSKPGFLRLAEHVLSPQCCDKKELLANDVAIGFALPRANVVKVHSALFYPEEAANSYDVVIQDVGMRISQHRSNERQKMLENLCIVSHRYQWPHPLCNNTTVPCDPACHYNT